MPRFALKLSLFLPLFAGVAAFNHAVFRDSNASLAWIEDKVEAIHRTGKPAMVPIEIFGAHAYHLRKADDPKFQPRVILLGSSRSNYVHSKYFAGREFYNCSINTGRLENFIDFYTRFAVKTQPPTEILIEASPFTLNENLEESLPVIKAALSRIQRDEDFAPIAPLARSTSGTPPASSALEDCAAQARIHFSPTYFQHALDGVYQSSLVQPLETDALKVDEHVVFTDGSREYPARARNKPAEAVRAAVVGQIEISMPKPFESCPEASKRQFERFLDLIQANGQRAVIFLPPYHPLFYEAARTHSNVLEKFEAYYRSVAQARGILVIGSYDPAKTGATEADLFDFHHPRGTGMDKAFKDYTPAIQK